MDEIQLPDALQSVERRRAERRRADRRAVCRLADGLVPAGGAVWLRAPPPLDRPLEVSRDADGSVALYDGESRVADGTPAELELEVPEPVTLEAAERATAEFSWRDRHPFPTCF